MQLAEVIGTVVATEKYKGLEGVRLLIIQPRDAEGHRDGDPIVACDALQAGTGDTVEWVTGREAALALQETFVPVDATVVAIVDHAWADSKAHGVDG